MAHRREQCSPDRLRQRSPALAVVGLLFFAVARYDSVVALGFMLFGVVLVEPALPDLIFGIAILVAILTGRTRSTLRRSPPIVLYALGSLIVLNVLSTAAARPRRAKRGSSYRSQRTLRSSAFGWRDGSTRNTTRVSLWNP